MITHLAAVAAGWWRWRTARTIADLANLQADRIARNLTTLTDGDPGPDWAMYQTLVALGRAGVVVHGWRRPASSVVDDVTLESRACVFGFAHDETKDWLDNLLYYASKEPGATKYKLDQVIELWAPGCLEYDRSDGNNDARWRGHPVGRIDGVVTEHIGRQMDARQIYRAFPTLRRRVQRELRRSWQIAICAPTWGESTMFDDLLPLLIASPRGQDATTAR